jgi:hypothetical protein
MNWSPSPQNQELARLRHADLLRAGSRRYALLRPEDRPLRPSRAPRSTLARLLGRLSPVS